MTSVRPSMRMGGLFARLVAATPERIFARFGEHALTFGALDQRSAALADWLCRNGVHPGDRVALMLRNGETALAVMLAIARIGAIWVPVNTQAVGDNLAYVLTHSTPRSLVDAGEAVAWEGKCNHCPYSSTPLERSVGDVLVVG